MGTLCVCALDAFVRMRLRAVAMVVAVNKCDRPNRDVPKVLQGLAGQGVELEEYGGSVPVVEISALRVSTPSPPPGSQTQRNNLISGTNLPTYQKLK